MVCFFVCSAVMTSFVKFVYFVQFLSLLNMKQEHKWEQKKSSQVETPLSKLGNELSTN